MPPARYRGLLANFPLNHCYICVMVSGVRTAIGAGCGLFWAGIPMRPSVLG